MKNYEELYNYSKYAFDEEVSRFKRVEDKAGKFITVITSLLAVYALTGRQLFGELIPAEDCIEFSLLVLASLVLIGLLASWGFAFRAMQIQGYKKAPLNDEVLKFYNKNKLVNIYYYMSKEFSKSLLYNKKITDLKTNNIENSFWCIVATVAFFTLFVVIIAINAYAKGVQYSSSTVITETTKLNTETKEEKIMPDSPNEPETEVQETPVLTPPDTSSETETPDPDIVAPEFEITTESFDPADLPQNIKSEQ